MKYLSIIAAYSLFATSVFAQPTARAAKTGGASSTNNNSTAGAGKAGNTPAPNTAAAGNASTGALVLPDGRIRQDAKPEDFNVLASVFKSAVVKGDGLNFSDIVVFPNVSASIFDKPNNTKAFEITISDKSIFIPQGGEPQTNIRRADLLPSIRSTLNNVSTTGVRTMHFSVQQDPARPLNTTHDYQIFNLESADFSFHQIDVRTGAANAGKIAIQGNAKNAAGQQTLASLDFPADKMVNIALKMDFNANTVQVFSSTGTSPLASVIEALPNDLAGNGEYHFSLQKNAVGTAAQPTGINEGMIFAGIFMEDSTNGQVTLQ